MHLTWLDSNSWLIEMGGQRILLDPWLVGPLVFGTPLFFKLDRPKPRQIPENIDLILLSQGLPDHAHPPTLNQLDRNIPVVASVNAAKVVKELGYRNITSLPHGESFTIPEKIKITATPGSPIGPTLLENGYLLTDLNTSTKLYYEPHGYHSPVLKEMAPVDVVITPIVDLEIPVVGSFIKGGKSALELMEWLKPKVIIPTATGGDVTFEGFLMSIIRVRGTVDDFRSLVAQHNLSTKVLDIIPGDRLELEGVAV
jgi:L-ascorbate metabolism protein UlaG (beta-lactamase superfamily)